MTGRTPRRSRPSTPERGLSPPATRGSRRGAIILKTLGFGRRRCSRSAGRNLFATSAGFPHQDESGLSRFLSRSNPTGYEYITCDMWAYGLELHIPAPRQRAPRRNRVKCQQGLDRASRGRSELTRIDQHNPTARSMRTNLVTKRGGGRATACTEFPLRRGVVDGESLGGLFR
jgi:hypothetical protein